MDVVAHNIHLSFTEFGDQFGYLQTVFLRRGADIFHTEIRRK